MAGFKSARWKVQERRSKRKSHMGLRDAREGSREGAKSCVLASLATIQTYLRPSGWTACCRIL